MRARTCSPCGTAHRLLVFSELVSLEAAALLCLDASFFGELVDDGVDGRSFHTHDVGDH